MLLQEELVKYLHSGLIVLEQKLLEQWVQMKKLKLLRIMVMRM